MRITKTQKRSNMEPGFNLSATKKPANLSINSDLLRKAKELKINLSRALEEHLIEIIREKQRKQWLLDNQEAIDFYNRKVAKSGVFSEGLRRF